MFHGFVTGLEIDPQTTLSAYSIARKQSNHMLLDKQRSIQAPIPNAASVNCVVPENIHIHKGIWVATPLPSPPSWKTLTPLQLPMTFHGEGVDISWNCTI